MLYIQGLFKHLLQKGNCSIMMEHDNKPGLKKIPSSGPDKKIFKQGR